MFCSLHVKNFAIIDDISIDFSNGMTVLTGETGAGKSLIIDATHLLLGSRLTNKVVRTGTTKAIIEGVFEGYNANVKELLTEYGIDELENDELIIRREITDTSKSTARINGMLVTLSQLEKIGANLIDIHTQNDTKKLFDNHNYLEFIDNDECRNLLVIYLEKRKEYLKNLKEYQELEKNINSGNQQLDFIKYQYQELVNAKLKLEEENNLIEELDYLNNFENINENLNNIKSEFKEHNINDSLYEIMNYLNKLAKFNEKYHDFVSRIQDAYYESLDIEASINEDLEKLDFDDERFDSINTRLSQLNELKRKYHLDIPELIAFRDKLEKQINLNDNKDILIEDLRLKLNSSYQELVTISKSLSQIRIKQANLLKEAVIKTLKDLMLEKVKFEIVFKPVDYNDIEKSDLFKPNGVDVIDFLISFNAGQPLESLSKIASGGEMSRIMLALKVYLMKELHLSTIIFDEIDSGISRNVAYVVGQKMQEISKNCQVLAITHLPIVASFANQHLYIEKNITNDDLTKVNVKHLNDEERVKELAIMLSPNTTDFDSVLKIANDMIRNNQN